MRVLFKQNAVVFLWESGMFYAAGILKYLSFNYEMVSAIRDSMESSF